MIFSRYTTCEPDQYRRLDARACRARHRCPPPLSSSPSSHGTAALLLSPPLPLLMAPLPSSSPLPLPMAPLSSSSSSSPSSHGTPVLLLSLCLPPWSLLPVPALSRPYPSFRMKAGHSQAGQRETRVELTSAQRSSVCGVVLVEFLLLDKELLVHPLAERT